MYGTTRRPTNDRFSPPQEIRSNTAERRAWCAAKVTELEAAGRVGVKTVGAGSYQEVVAKIVREGSTKTMLRGVCQVCDRRIGATHGPVAHHGYTRPEHGWQTASCDGAQHATLQDDNAQLVYHIEKVRSMITDLEARAAKLAARPAVLRVTEREYDRRTFRYIPTTVEYRSDDTASSYNGNVYDHALGIAVANNASELNATQAHLTTQLSRNMDYMAGKYAGSTYEEVVPA